MATFQLTNQQLKGLLRQERSKARREVERQAKQRGRSASSHAGPLEIVAPLGVDLVDSGEDFTPEYQGALQTGTREIIDAMNPAGLTQAGYPYTICAGAEMAAKDTSKMSATFVVVTRQKSTNRHGNMVQILPGNNGQGLQIEDWSANPVVMFDHGMGLALPIGSAAQDGKLYWQAQKNKAVSTVFFSQTLPEAAAIYALIDEGILKAASVQFAPNKAMRLATKKEDLPEGVESLNWQGWDFTESSLYEWSVVAIPADPGALKKSLEAGKIAGQKIGIGLKYALAQSLTPSPVQVAGVTLPVPAQSAASAAAPMPIPATTVDTVAQTGTVFENLLQNGEQLAREFRQSLAKQQQTPVPDMASLAEAIRQEVGKAIQPIAADQRKLSERIATLAGS